MSGRLGDVDRLGPYRRLRSLGSGVPGTVFLAEGPAGRVALRVLSARRPGSPASIGRFEREVDAALRIVHPSVVRTLAHDVLYVDGRERHVLVTEYVEGRTLRELLGVWGRAPEALVREIARQTAAGLEAIHAAGGVHGNLALQNVIVTEDHRVRIMDPGVACLVDEASGRGSGADTVGPAPPVTSEPSHRASTRVERDLGAFGALLYELLTGEPPWPARIAPAARGGPGDRIPPRVDTRRPEVSAFLTELVHALLTRPPAAGLATGHAVCAVLAGEERSAWWVDRSRALAGESRGQPRVPVRRATPLHGRRAELALLVRGWERACAGEGNVVHVVGEAGSGKTRLVDEFLRGIDAAGAHRLYGSYAAGSGLGGVSDALLARFGSAGLEDALRPYVPAAPALLPALAAILRRELPPAGAAPLSDEALEAVLVQLLRGLAAERPVVWVVEDLHGAAPAAVRRVLALGRALDGHRVLLVLTSRGVVPGQGLAALCAPPRGLRCVLRRLGAPHVTRFLEDALGNRSLAARLGARIASASDGIPFFVVELLRSLEERGALVELPGGKWVEAGPIEALVLPAAIRDLVAARLADLTRSERTVLDVAALQGHEFDPTLTAEVLGREAIDVLQDLARLERRSGILHLQGRRCRFDHHAIRTLIRDELPPSLCEAYHAGLADAILRCAAAGPDGAPDGATCVVLCEHLLRGGRGAAALAYLPTALDHLESCHLQDEAVALGERALAADGLLAGAGRCELLRRTASTLHPLGRPEHERRILDEAVRVADAAGDPALGAAVRGDLGRLLQRTARYEEAAAVLGLAIEQARRAGARAVRIRAEGRLGDVRYAQGRLRAARRHYECQQRLAAAAGDALAQAQAIGNLGTVLADQRRYREARACFERHLAVAQAAGDEAGVRAVHGNLGALLATEGRYDEARAHLERHLAHSLAMGDRRGESRAVGSLGYVAGMQGRWPEALQRHERHLALAREIGDRRGEGTATANLGNVFVNLGRFEDARTCFEDWLEIAREIESPGGEARANGQLGFVCLVESRLAEARRYLERWLDLARGLGDGVGASQAQGYLGDIALEEGRFESARVHYGRLLRRSRARRDPRAEGIAHGGLGALDLELGHTHAAMRHYERRLSLAQATHDRQGESGARVGARERPRGAGASSAGLACTTPRAWRSPGRSTIVAARRSHSVASVACTRASAPRAACSSGGCRSAARSAIDGARPRPGWRWGGCCSTRGRPTAARPLLAEALAEARRVTSPALTVRAACCLARVGGRTRPSRRPSWRRSRGGSGP